MWSARKSFPENVSEIYFQLAEELSAVGLEPQNKENPYLYKPEGQGRRVSTEVKRINDSKLFQIFFSRLRHPLISGNTNSRQIATGISVQQWLKRKTYTGSVWRRNGPAS